jgi:hypothetical protein
MRTESQEKEGGGAPGKIWAMEALKWPIEAIGSHQVFLSRQGTKIPLAAEWGR